VAYRLLISVIDYSLITLISHRYYWLLIDDLLITYQLSFCTNITNFLLFCTNIFLILLSVFYLFVLHNRCSCLRNYADTKGQTTYQHIETCRSVILWLIDYSLIIGNNQWLINWLPIDYLSITHWCHQLDTPGKLFTSHL